MAEFKRKFLPAVVDNKYRLYCTAICLTALSVCCYLLFNLLNIVTVQYDNNSKTILSMFSNKELLLEIANIQPNKDDRILYTSFPGNYTNITIESPFDVPVTVDGNTINAKIHSGTVEDCLQTAGVILGEHDYTEPSLHSPVDENSAIRVYRVEYKDTQYEETIPFETEYKENSLTYRFKRRQYVLNEGINGKNLVTYRERFVDGEMESSLVTKVEVIREPVNKVVLKYGKSAISPMPAPAGVTINNNVPSRYKQVLTNVSATGYSASRGRGASGLGLECGTVAVNPNIIPYGSKLYITSPDGQFVYGFAIATDTGASLLNGAVGIDLFYDTFKEANLNWKNAVNVYIIE